MDVHAHPGARGGQVEVRGLSEASPAVLRQHSAAACDQSRGETLAEPQQSAAVVAADVEELGDPAAEFYDFEYSDDGGDGDGEDGGGDGDGGGGDGAEAAALRRIEPWRVAVRRALGGADGIEPPLPCHILPHLLLGDMAS